MIINKKMIDKSEVGIISGLLGIILGIGIQATFPSTQSNTAKIFQEEGKPRVIRTIEHARKDDIYVEDVNEKGNYIYLNGYLESINYGHDRDMEEERIKKQVNW